MDLTLVGGMELATSSSTLVTIQSVVPNKGSYLPQYFWVVSPIVVPVAFMLNNPYLLLGVPALVGFSLMTLVLKQQDRQEIIRIIDRALDRT